MHAEKIAEIIVKVQQRFFLDLFKELNHESVSFPQFFLLDFLVRQEVITMSNIASRMGYTTVAAIGLVDRLEKLGYIARSHAEDGHWKVMV